MNTRHHPQGNLPSQRSIIVVISEAINANADESCFVYATRAYLCYNRFTGGNNNDETKLERDTAGRQTSTMGRHIRNDEQQRSDRDKPGGARTDEPRRGVFAPL